MGRTSTLRAFSARKTALAAALALAGISGTAFAASNDAALLAELKKLAERMEKLEKRNTELEKKLEQSNAGEQRLKALEEHQAQADKALQTERLSEKEPEMVTRLKAVEFQTLSMQKQARQIEALEGITVGASLTGVVQKVNRSGAASATRESRANYRGDVSVTLPGGDMGDMEGQIFTQFRFGQGNGVGLRPTYTSTPNTTAFQVTGVNDPDSSFAILAQAWYQLNVPLPVDGYKPHSKERLELNFGKIDPFVFFDQNAAADDESARFMNNAFVHNPLLDSGGDIGADAYGFAPGARLAYISEQAKPETWGASVGVFGSGPGANFSGSLSEPFVIAQLETSRKFFGGLPGNYRLYAWTNGHTLDLQDKEQRHSGFGLSLDQRLGRDWNLFGRYGRRTS
ncbi:MAG: transporter, partial [Rhodocyclales bacterium]|nr:transporter [Rhodocyclales bacterium]